MSETNIVTLDEIAYVNNSSVNKQFPYGVIEYTDTASVTNNCFDPPVIYKIEDAPSRAKRLVSDGDTIISTVRPIQRHYGYIKSTVPNHVVSTGFAVVTPRNVDPKYLYYYLTQPRITTYLNTIAESGTTTFPAFKPEELKKLKIALPTLDRQKDIGEILSSLDDKIELNNKINAELEALAQTLFKRWFVDFEFPNENGEPYKSSGGELVESELGMIPNGWKVKRLEEVADVSIGRTPPRKEDQWFSEDPKDLKWVSIRDMGKCGVYIANTSEYLTESAVSKFNIPVIAANTVIVSFKLTVGRVSITTERMLSNEAIAHINLVDESIYPEFMYLYFRQFDFETLGSTSSIATAVNSKSIKALKVIHPDKAILSRFHDIIQDLFRLIRSYSLETDELAKIQNILLPKLISGELEVSDLQPENLTAL